MAKDCINDSACMINHILLRKKNLSLWVCIFKGEYFNFPLIYGACDVSLFIGQEGSTFFAITPNKT